MYSSTSSETKPKTGSKSKKRSTSVPPKPTTGVTKEEPPKTTSKKPATSKKTTKQTGALQSTLQKRSASTESNASKRTSSAKSRPPSGVSPSLQNVARVRAMVQPLAKSFELACKTVPGYMYQIKEDGLKTSDLRLLALIFPCLYYNKLLVSKKIAAQWSKLLCMHGLVRVYQQFLQALIKSDQEILKNVTDDEKREYLAQLLANLWTLTDVSPVICEAMCKHPALLTDLLQMLHKQPFNSLRNLDKMDDPVNVHTVNAVLSSAYNCVWHRRDLAAPVILSANGLQLARNAYTLAELRYEAGFLIACCISKNEAHRLDDFHKFLNVCYVDLERSLSNVAHLYEGSCAEELMYGVNAVITQNERMRKLAFDMGFYELHFTAAQRPIDDDELLVAIQGLLAFSSLHGAKAKLMNMDGFFECITKLLEHKNDIIQEHARSLGDRLAEIGDAATKANQRPKTPVTQVKKWTPADVRVWLQTNDLYNVSKQVDWLDGKMLLSFKNLHSKQPATFYKDIRESLGIEDFKDIAKLASLLDDLE